MASTCTYECGGTAPPLSPNSDITGVGVVINFIVTAGIAVFAILIHFLMIFQPLRDPFCKNDLSPSRSFRPNPIDVFILRWLRSLPILKGIARVGASLETSFTNCLIAMGDLQLVTGFSIMISGFVQLHCGLATYYWLVILELAWFSSLTHLSCLTLLRTYLVNHTTERTWRLITMALLAALLVVGFLYTGNYYWTSADTPSGPPLINDPAICYLSTVPPGDPNNSTLWTMIISIIVIIVGFSSRTVKLYETLSIHGFSRARSQLSRWARKLLRIVHSWACARTPPYSLRRTLCYRPLLACFLSMRLFLDGWSSVFLEVSWLVVAFVWGIIRLQLTFEAAGFKVFSSRMSDWTFGQIAAIVLLIGPITAAFASFGRDKTASNRVDANTESPDHLMHDSWTRNSASPPRTPRSLDIDDPDNDWQLHSCALGSGISYAVLVFLLWSAAVFQDCVASRRTIAYMVSYGIYGIPLAVGGCCGVMIYSMAIEDILGKRRRKVRHFLQSITVIVFVVGNGYLWALSFLWVAMIPAAALLYIIGAFVYRVLGGWRILK